MVKVVGALLYQTWYQPAKQLRQPGVVSKTNLFRAISSTIAATGTTTTDA